MKQALDEHGSRLSAEDKQKAEVAVQETIRWLDSNQMAEQEEFDSKLHELQSVCQSVMANLHQQPPSSASSCSQQAASAGMSQPTVEEVD